MIRPSFCNHFEQPFRKVQRSRVENVLKVPYFDKSCTIFQLQSQIWFRDTRWWNHPLHTNLGDPSVRSRVTEGMKIVIFNRIFVLSACGFADFCIKLGTNVGDKPPSFANKFAYNKHKGQGSWEVGKRKMHKCWWNKGFRRYLWPIVQSYQDT